MSPPSPPVTILDGDPPLAERTIERLRPYLAAAAPENPEPLAVVDVLAGGRPAAWIHRPSRVTGEAFADLLASLPIHRRAPPRGPGYVLAADPGRFDRLPPADAADDAFDRRMGEFLGYPPEAIEGYVEREAPTTRRGAILVARGQVAPAAFAYAKLAPWVRPLSRAALARQIADGKRIADRLLAVNARCGVRDVAASVARVYHAERRRLVAKRRASDGVLARLPFLDPDRHVPDLEAPLPADLSIPG